MISLSIEVGFHNIEINEKGLLMKIIVLKCPFCGGEVNLNEEVSGFCLR